MKKTELICGAGIFIRAHLVKKLKRKGVWVIGVDVKYPPSAETHDDDFGITK